MASHLAPEVRSAAIEQRLLGYLGQYDRKHDERAIFTFLYSQVLGNLTAVFRQTPPFFDDPDWVATLAEVFAQRFFNTMDAIDTWLAGLKQSGERGSLAALYQVAPRPWADTYWAIRRHAFVWESLLFAMMAHLTHDLPKAVIDAKSETAGQSHLADYHRMNDILANQTASLEKAIAFRYNPLLPFDRLATREGEFFSNYGIRITRSLAWYNADRLLDPRSLQDTLDSLDRTTAAFIDFMRRPKEWWLRILIILGQLLLPRYHRWPRH